MGALRGSISVRRYRVFGKLPREIRTRYTKQIRVHAHVPIDPASEVDKSVGWVSAIDPYDADLDADKVFFGERLVLGLRVDTLKAPPAEVKRILAERAASEEERTGKPLGRRERRVLGQLIERELRARVFPRTRVVDLAWHFGEHGQRPLVTADGPDEERGQSRLYFWSTSKAANELLLELFPKTFGLELEPEGPGQWARERVKSARTLANLQPTPELLLGFEEIRRISNAAVEDE
jgi:recombination associated protein RdgC